MTRKVFSFCHRTKSHTILTGCVSSRFPKNAQAVRAKYLIPAGLSEKGHMEKTITVKEFAEELIERIDKHKTIDCCKDEIKRLALLAAEKLGDENIRVHWKDSN